MLDHNNGSEDLGTDNDTDWYYIDDGEITYAKGEDLATDLKDDNKPVYAMRKKIKASGNKYFCFNEKGQMQTGLQYVPDDGGFYYFDENGYQKTGRVASVECEDDDYSFYFNTTNGKNGLGYTGEKDNYLYFNGKRLEADDDYRFYIVKNDVYLVNSKGKIQKATGNGKEYDDIENEGYATSDDIRVITNGNGVVTFIGNTPIANIKADIDFSGDPVEDRCSTKVSVPFIALFDNVFTYDALNDEGWR